MLEQKGLEMSETTTPICMELRPRRDWARELG